MPSRSGGGDNGDTAAWVRLFLDILADIPPLTSQINFYSTQFSGSLKWINIRPGPESSRFAL
jgi:hypothetical protein